LRTFNFNDDFGANSTNLVFSFKGDLIFGVTARFSFETSELKKLIINCNIGYFNLIRLVDFNLKFFGAGFFLAKLSK